MLRLDTQHNNSITKELINVGHGPCLPDQHYCQPFIRYQNVFLNGIQRRGNYSSFFIMMRCYLLKQSYITTLFYFFYKLKVIDCSGKERAMKILTSIAWRFAVLLFKKFDISKYLSPLLTIWGHCRLIDVFVSVKDFVRFSQTQMYWDALLLINIL